MQYATIQGIDQRVSRIAFGCMSTVPSQMYAGLQVDEAVRTMQVAMDLGITLFDTARAYADGESERQLGRAIKGRRDELVIASKPKAGDLSRDEIVSECEQSLKSLDIDCIDLYQIHWPRRVVPLEETARAMESLVTSGKVRAIGVCNFGPLDMQEWLDTAPCATNQIAFSLLVRCPEFGTEPVCEERGVGILCYSPLAQGLLAGVYGSADDVPSGKARTRHFSKERPEARHTESGCEAETFTAIDRIRGVAEGLGVPMGDVAIAWLLARPSVTSVLIGASRPDQVERNVRALSVELSEGDIAELNVATEDVKSRLGESIDMWATPPRTR
ncbi:MAG: aldo/keto reductase [Planctomycetota bacterium]